MRQCASAWSWMGEPLPGVHTRTSYKKEAVSLRGIEKFKCRREVNWRENPDAQF
jgi:hypothetical protein